jgi:DNA-binding LacI/PurR family transcriptional regulator
MPAARRQRELDPPTQSRQEENALATIDDVAKAAGVSRSTVSYALSGKRSISSETRRRIDDAIKQLKFTPNAGARALRTAQTGVLGLLVQFHEDEFAPAMLQYILPIAETARSLGYDILMMTENDGAEALTRAAESGMVDGVILLDVTEDDPRVGALRAARQPGVLVGLPGDTRGLDVVDLDFGAAARNLVDHLFDLGHRDVVLVSPPEHVFLRGGTYSWRFRDAAVQRASQIGLELTARYGESQQPAIDKNLHEILDESPDATGVIMHNDASVAALPHLLHERGVRVPDDLSVVSLYSRDFARWFSLPYTAVESSPGLLGQVAITQLTQRIAHGEDAGPHGIRLVTAEVVDRGSTR